MLWKSGPVRPANFSVFAQESVKNIYSLSSPRPINQSVEFSGILKTAMSFISSDHFYATIFTLFKKYDIYLTF